MAPVLQGAAVRDPDRDPDGLLAGIPHHCSIRLPRLHLAVDDVDPPRCRVPDGPDLHDHGLFEGDALLHADRRPDDDDDVVAVDVAGAAVRASADLAPVGGRIERGRPPQPGDPLPDPVHAVLRPDGVHAVPGRVRTVAASRRPVPAEENAAHPPAPRHEAGPSTQAATPAPVLGGLDTRSVRGGRNDLRGRHPRSLRPVREVHRSPGRPEPVRDGARRLLLHPRRLGVVGAHHLVGPRRDHRQDPVRRLPRQGAPLPERGVHAPAARPTRRAVRPPPAVPDTTASPTPRCRLRLDRLRLLGHDRIRGTGLVPDVPSSVGRPHPRDVRDRQRGGRPDARDHEHDRPGPAIPAPVPADPVHARSPGDDAAVGVRDRPTERPMAGELPTPGNDRRRPCRTGGTTSRRAHPVRRDPLDRLDVLHPVLVEPALPHGLQRRGLRQLPLGVSVGGSRRVEVGDRRARAGKDRRAASHRDGEAGDRQRRNRPQVHRQVLHLLPGPAELLLRADRRHDQQVRVLPDAPRAVLPAGLVGERRTRHRPALPRREQDAA